MDGADAAAGPGVDPPADERRALDAILAVVRVRQGTDFGGYRRETIRRRVLNRARSAAAPTLEAYLHRLRTDPAELGELLGRLTIKVSRFFRNPEAVEVVRAALAARAAAAPGRALRVWSAGCGRGEEAYTLALLLAELGQPAGGGQVIGTDLDPAALREGGEARYPAEAVADVPPALRARHLPPATDRGAHGVDQVRVQEDLRGRVSLRLHDLTTAAGPPEPGAFDLVACRNTLIYFQPAVQARVQRLLVRALAPGGLLWLGEAEWPSRESARRLEVVHRRARLFRARREALAA